MSNAHRFLNLMLPASTALLSPAIGHYRALCEVPGLTEEHATIPDTWQIDTRKVEPFEEEGALLWYSRYREVGQDSPRDPVEAGLRAVAPSVARIGAYYRALMEEEFAGFRRAYDERLARVESAVAADLAGPAHGRALLEDTIAQLRAEMGTELDDISEAEEAELWKLVDFSIEVEGE